MPDTRKYYVISGDKCFFESMTKEEILTAITQAVETHEISDVDTGFVQTIKEQNHGTGLKFWIGTTAEYNALQTIDPDCFYILTDDTKFEDIEADLQSFRDELGGINDVISGLSDTVSEHTSEISDLSDAVTAFQARTGFVFLEDEHELPYQPSFLVPVELDYIHGDTPTYIDDFMLVLVYTAQGFKIPCTVRRTSTALTIQGVSHNGSQLYESEGSGCGFKRDINILLDLDPETRSILGNRSTTTQFTKHYSGGAYSTDITFAGCSIYKIVGVM